MGPLGGGEGGGGWGGGWGAGLVAGLVSMIDGSPALQARRHSRPDSMHCMQLAGSSSIRPRCRAYAAKRRHYQSPLRKTEKPGPEISGVATAPLVLPVFQAGFTRGLGTRGSDPSAPPSSNGARERQCAIPMPKLSRDELSGSLDRRAYVRVPLTMFQKP